MAEAPRYSGGVIYALVDRRSGAIRYVGKTGGYARSRLSGHTKGALAGGRLPVHQWIRELADEGVAADVIELQRDPLDRDAAETEWIRRLRASGADLLNIQGGGTGWTKGLPQSEEGNRKRSQHLKERRPTEGQLAGLVKAREAARDPEVRKRAGRAIAAARKGKRYADNPHGTRKRYRQGCKCDLCRAANTAYALERYRVRLCCPDEGAD